MPVNFIPNDPLARHPGMRSIDPRSKRPSNRVGFNYFSPAPEGQYNPGTREFLYWQCREAALMSLDLWETLDGRLRNWAVNRRRLDLRQDAGNDLNAYYDRRSLSFFRATIGQKTTYSGASTDVVAHEAGHAFLDAIRPDLWDSFYPEVNAFHEGFGDIIAILTALADRETRVKLFALKSDLRSGNFVEATGEELADAIRRWSPTHNAAVPRRALNRFKWQIPGTLPITGGPGVLINESHSLGQIISGCLYNTILNIFAGLPNNTEKDLWAATETAGRIFTEATKTAPEVARFFQAVGRAMVHTDQRLNKGANRRAIHDAFVNHNILLGSSAMVAPTALLAGRAPNPHAARTSAILASSTRSDIVRRLGAVARERLSITPLRLGDTPIAAVSRTRFVSLDDVDPRLAGVVAPAVESVLVGASGNRAAFLGRMPDVSADNEEVKGFVASLVEHDALQLDGGESTEPAHRPTHGIRTRAGRRVLSRLRYACGPGRAVAISICPSLHTCDRTWPPTWSRSTAF